MYKGVGIQSLEAIPLFVFSYTKKRGGGGGAPPLGRGLKWLPSGILGRHGCRKRARRSNAVCKGIFVYHDCTELNKMSFDETVWCAIQLWRAEKLIDGLCY